MMCPHCGKKIPWKPGNPCAVCGGLVKYEHLEGVIGQGKEIYAMTEASTWTCTECGETMRYEGSKTVDGKIVPYMTTHGDDSDDMGKPEPGKPLVLAAPIEELMSDLKDWEKGMAARHVAQIHSFDGKDYVPYEAWDKAVVEVYRLLREKHGE
jgi:hypothetical protein